MTTKFQSKHDIGDLTSQTERRLLEIETYLSLKPVFDYAEMNYLRGLHFLEVVCEMIDHDQIALKTLYSSLSRNQNVPTKREICILCKSKGFTYLEVHRNFGIAANTYAKHIREYANDKPTLLPLLPPSLSEDLIAVNRKVQYLFAQLGGFSALMLKKSREENR